MSDLEFHRDGMQEFRSVKRVRGVCTGYIVPPQPFEIPQCPVIGWLMVDSSDRQKSVPATNEMMAASLVKINPEYAELFKLLSQLPRG